MVNQVHSTRGHLPLRAILSRMRHDGCGGLAEGGAADRHRVRAQPSGPEDRAAGGLIG